MNLHLPHIGRRTLLVGIAVLALLLGGLREGINYYQTKVAERANSRQALLLYRKQIRGLPVLRQRVQLLQRQARNLEGLLFGGDSIDAVTSAVQIRLQGMITKAGLEPESLRPLSSHRQKEARAIQTITIKMRLAGTLPQFEQFLAQLYRSRQLFLIDSFTIKPYRKDSVKIFIDVKGLYRLQGDGDVGSGSSVAGTRGRRS